MVPGPDEQAANCTAALRAHANKVFCNICRKVFGILHRGKSDVRLHASGKQHITNGTTVETNTLVSSPHYVTLPLPLSRISPILI